MVRNAKQEDFDQILEIYSGARDYMRKTGNPTQWGDDYPPVDLLREDIPCGRLFVCEENGRIQAVFAYIEGDDPSYHEIDGAWLNDEPYAAIHRVASRGEVRGMVDQILAWSFEKCENLRIDTHNDNWPMQKAIERNGFVKCGTIIFVGDGTPRIAYHGIKRRG